MQLRDLFNLKTFKLSLPYKIKLNIDLLLESNLFILESWPFLGTAFDSILSLPFYCQIYQYTSLTLDFSRSE